MILFRPNTHLIKFICEIAQAFVNNSTDLTCDKHDLEMLGSDQRPFKGTLN